MNIQKMGY